MVRRRQQQRQFFVNDALLWMPNERRIYGKNMHQPRLLFFCARALLYVCCNMVWQQIIKKKETIPTYDSDSGSSSRSLSLS